MAGDKASYFCTKCEKKHNIGSAIGRRHAKFAEVPEVLTWEEYKTLVEAGYTLEPYHELCIVKSRDPYYRDGYERMLETAKEILKET